METNIYLFSILLYHFLSQIEHLFVSNLCNILFIMDKSIFILSSKGELFSKTHQIIYYYVLIKV